MFIFSNYNDAKLKIDDVAKRVTIMLPREKELGTVYSTPKGSVN